MAKRVRKRVTLGFVGFEPQQGATNRKKTTLFFIFIANKRAWFSVVAKQTTGKHLLSLYNVCLYVCHKRSPEQIQIKIFDPNLKFFDKALIP